ncbi:MAG TPA: repressor LexA [Planctomycetes bacterium]|nr:repressor LexA [Planctomycetota bacterium]|tara:strand:+ start:372 stop:1040 length:669 start_codon:yes stop_codon:yes gene_type:complete
MARPLTSRQLEVLQSFARTKENNHISPTLEELGQSLGINRITVYGHIQALLAKGYLENLLPGASRGLELTEVGENIAFGKPRAQAPSLAPFPGEISSHLPSLPLLGRIAAGEPIEAIEDRSEVPIADLLKIADDTYLLEVKGNSMVDAHIQDGDMVVIRRDRPPRDGDIVVGVLPDETATLKRFYPQPDGGTILQPANPEMAPIYCEELEVRGVVTGVIRRY